MIILNALFPVMILIALGILLKHIGLTNDDFLQTTDKLIYYIFFPLMLFWKIGGASVTGSLAVSLCLASCLALGVVFVLSCVAIRVFKISQFQAGSFVQSCFRFNTYIGFAVILNSLGEQGVGYFGVLIGIVIPLINVVAVSTLIWFSGKKHSKKKQFEYTLRALCSNPLILGCLSGIIYSQFINEFPQFIENSLSLVSSVTLPLALLSIGGALTFSGVHKNMFVSLLAATLKLAILPAAGYFCLMFFQVSGTPFLVGMIFFALPTSTAIYVLSSQLHSDTQLASSSILISTLLSFPVLTLILYLLPKNL